MLADLDLLLTAVFATADDLRSWLAQAVASSASRASTASSRVGLIVKI